MKEKKEYIYCLKELKLVKKEVDMILNAIEFFSVASILINNNDKKSNACKSLGMLLRQHLIREEV